MEARGSGPGGLRMTRFRTLDPRRLQGVGEAVTWHPSVRPVLATLPVGRQRFWGVPFRIPREWLTVLAEQMLKAQPVRVEIPPGIASAVVKVLKI